MFSKYNIFGSDQSSKKKKRFFILRLFIEAISIAQTTVKNI